MKHDHGVGIAANMPLGLGEPEEYLYVTRAIAATASRCEVCAVEAVEVIGGDVSLMLVLWRLHSYFLMSGGVPAVVGSEDARRMGSALASVSAVERLYSVEFLLKGVALMMRHLHEDGGH